MRGYIEELYSTPGNLYLSRTEDERKTILGMKMRKFLGEVDIHQVLPEARVNDFSQYS